MIRVGVLALQGGVAEHIYSTRRAMEKLGITGEVAPVKKPEDLGMLDAIIIPGGESTTIGRLAARIGLLEPLREAIRGGLPTLGTCAGAVLLAKKVTDRRVGSVQQPLLRVLDAAVIRNYFGRQPYSFEVDLKIPVLGEEPFRGVFIRAPVFEEVWGNCEVLAALEGKPVFVRQGAILATAFHPELTGDTRIHEMLIREAKS